MESVYDLFGFSDIPTNLPYNPIPILLSAVEIHDFPKNFQMVYANIVNDKTYYIISGNVDVSIANKSIYINIILLFIYLLNSWKRIYSKQIYKWRCRKLIQFM